MPKPYLHLLECWTSGKVITETQNGVQHLWSPLGHRYASLSVDTPVMLNAAQEAAEVCLGCLGGAPKNLARLNLGPSVKCEQYAMNGNCLVWCDHNTLSSSLLQALLAQDRSLSSLQYGVQQVWCLYIWNTMNSHKSKAGYASSNAKRRAGHLQHCKSITAVQTCSAAYQCWSSWTHLLYQRSNSF